MDTSGKIDDGICERKSYIHALSFPRGLLRMQLDLVVSIIQESAKVRADLRE